MMPVKKGTEEPQQDSKIDGLEAASDEDESTKSKKGSASPPLADKDDESKTAATVTKDDLGDAEMVETAKKGEGEDDSKNDE